MDFYEIVKHVILDFSQNHNLSAITEETWLIELGLDSVTSADMIMELEERLNIEISDQDAVSLTTVRDVFHLIERYVC